MSEPIIMTMRAAIEPTSRSYEDLVDRAKQHAPDPKVFDEYTAAFWRAQVSNNTIDFYGTSMAQSTLTNYVDDLNRGISYQDSHDWGRLGLGQSILGEFVETRDTVAIVDQPVRQVHGTFFTLEGIELGGHQTSNFLAAIRSGTYRDVSIGFYARDITCSICHKQSFHWWEEDGCMHLPGVEYEVDKKKVLAWASVNDGRLMETSQVYDGATPGAEVNQVVVKTNSLAAERMITEREIASVEQKYAIRVARPAPVVPVAWNGDPAQRVAGGLVMSGADKKREKDASQADVKDSVTGTTPDDTIGSQEPQGTDIDNDVLGAGGEGDGVAAVSNPAVVNGPESLIPDETVINLPTADPAKSDDAEAGGNTADVLSEERARLKGHGIELGKDPAKAVRALGDALLEQVRQNATLAADAELGKKYRKNVVESALAEGVRARGEHFKRETYEEMLSSLTIEQVEVIRDDFKAEATRNLTHPAVKLTDADDITGGEDTPKQHRSRHKVG